MGRIANAGTMKKAFRTISVKNSILLTLSCSWHLKTKAIPKNKKKTQNGTMERSSHTQIGRNGFVEHDLFPFKAGIAFGKRRKK